MTLDLGSLREGPLPYLGWYLEGEAIAGVQPTYWCCATEDVGSNQFRVTAVAGSVAGDRKARYRAARDASFALAKGKVFLGTWEHGRDYKVRLPLAREKLSTQEIRNWIVRGLFRLYENDFAEDSFQVDLDGIAFELGITRPAVDRAVDRLYHDGLIEEHGTHGKHRGTGHFWLSSEGAAYVEDTLESPPDIVGAAPVTSERHTDFATDRKRVAVVQGRDNRPTETMFNFLRALRLSPIEWTEAIAATGKGTPYNKEAVAELFKDTQAVVVLMTGDDDAQLREQLRRPEDDAFESELRPQPRPNVLIELGMAFGIMDARTIIVEVGKLRPISDLAGLNVVRLSRDASTRKKLVERLKAAGCDLDDSGQHWLTVGDFTPTPPKRHKRTAKPAVSPTEEALKRENEELKARIAALKEAQNPVLALDAVAEENGARLREERNAWAEERDRPRFEALQQGVTRTEAAFVPQFKLKHVLGDPVANLEWRFRGPRFFMEWRAASGSALDRTKLSGQFDLSGAPQEDDLVGVDEMGLEIRFHWRGRWWHELHRWPISRRQLPHKTLWDVHAERLPPLYFDHAE